ncbi:MAG: tetratricopeptide repeat protein [Rhodospirillales bacterium]|nr:tetratricopeptide repeat protein [Rhodospirillales bacterium]MCW8861148.1 tetratricopeptide repeat protein [Rhodospirillales bacterium]MCW8970353.1 tetratricopeptide repeat protein [Rhodospirillales bacterium]MCW9001101.1 tetratricopeptide repeat protein [Rhodospirillales bacterium]
MADQTNDSFIREVDEELRNEQMRKLWKTYGSYVIGTVTLIILVVAGYQGWRTWDMNTRTELGERFASAERMAVQGQAAAAKDAFAGIAVDNGGDGGYGMLARFREAALIADGGDRNAASIAFLEIADDSGVEGTYRELATILGALQGMDTAESPSLVNRLAPLADGAGPWRFSARELLAFIAHKTGDIARAKELFTGLSGDAAAPQGVRSRATEMLETLGG